MAINLFIFRNDLDRHRFRKDARKKQAGTFRSLQHPKDFIVRTVQMTLLHTSVAYAVEQILYITMRTSLPSVFTKNALIIVTDSVSDVGLFA